MSLVNNESPEKRSRRNDMVLINMHENIFNSGVTEDATTLGDAKKLSSDNFQTP